MPFSWLLVALTVATGLMQGFGLALFVPLLRIMDGSPADLEFPFSLIRDAVAMMGLPLDLPVLLAGIAGLTILGFALTFAQRSLVMGYSFNKFVERISAKFVNGLMQASWHYASKQATGEIINQLTVEVRRSGRCLSHLLVSTAAAIQIVVFLGFSLTMFWELVLIALFFGAIAVIAIRPLQQRTFRYGERLTDANNNFAFNTVDFLTNLKLVKTTGSEHRVSERINGLQDTVCNVIRNRQIIYAATEFVIQVFPVLLVVTVIAVANILLQAETAPVLVFLLFLARMVPLATQCQQEYQAYAMEVSAVYLVDSIIADQQANRDEPHCGASTFSQLNDGIRFEGVSYRFPGAENDALREIDLTVGHAQTVAIVGGSGAGKSTMIDLLCGLRHPTSGRILLDGVDLADIDSLSWRQRIGYVTQDIVVFNDTLRNNIVFAHPEAGESDVERAIRAAHLDEVVDSLPDGFNTIMGEGGVRLSGGQKQRLALARALVGNPELLLLDEATSALDNESEHLVQRSIESLAQELTIVIVAHRLSTIRKADLICVMERGRIVEMGNHDTLLAQNGRFAELYDLQFS
jgi:ATP-binding cassette, subfamily B, bacterial MsbA